MGGEVCGDRRELLALQAVGLLEADAEAELEAHLASCPAWTEALRQLTAAAEAAGTGEVSATPRRGSSTR